MRRRSPSPPPDRRARRKQELRERILDAARELFEEQGVHATKVAEICARADVARKTFFNHFPAKQDLVDELAGRGLDELLAEIDAARRHPGPTAARLARFFEGIAESAREAGPMHREVLNEIIHAAHGAGTQSRQARLLHDAFGAIVRAGLEAGDVTRRHPPEVLTEMVMGAFYALMFNWAHLEGYPIAARARATACFLADAVAPSRLEAAAGPSAPAAEAAGEDASR